jgi:diacylglycerol kinase (ATP)
MHLGVIANPYAGRGRTGAFVDAFRSQLHDLGMRITFEVTGGPGDGATLARHLSRTADVLCVIGGDGTIHEVVNGVMPDPRPVAIIPTGTGNDVAALVACPKDPAELAETIREGYVARLDVLQIGAHYCINSVGLGFEGLVNYHSHSITWARGSLLYMAAVFKALRSFSNPDLIIQLPDGQVIDGERFMLSIGNGIRAGGSFYLTPDAFPDDGKIDLCVIDPMRVARILFLLPTALRGTHSRHREVRMFRVSSLVVESKTPYHMHIDGEYIDSPPRRLEVTLHHRRLPVICKRHGRSRLVHPPEKLF